MAFAQSVHREIVIEDDREPAPRFHAKTLAGEQFSNESTKGKVVLFQFWTTWCPYCKSEEGLVNDLTTEFADKGLVVIAVDVAESKKVVQHYLKDHPRKCHIVMTGDTNLAAMYAANRYPIYVVVDREGKIVDTQHGSGGERPFAGCCPAPVWSPKSPSSVLGQNKRPPAGGLLSFRANAI